MVGWLLLLGQSNLGGGIGVDDVVVVGLLVLLEAAVLTRKRRVGGEVWGCAAVRVRLPCGCHSARKTIVVVDLRCLVR